MHKDSQVPLQITENLTDRIAKILSSSDMETKGLLSSIEKHHLKSLELKNKERNEQVEILTDDRKARKKYASRIINFIIIFSISVFIFIVLYAFLTQSDAVVIAFLATFAIEVIALAVIVIKYLFFKKL